MTPGEPTSPMPTSPHRSRLVPSSVLYRIHEELGPTELWLFGSRARGDANDASDWDILAVVPDDTPPESLELPRLWARLRDLRLMRVDVFPVKRADFDVARHELGTLCQIATTEGVRLDGA